MPDYDPIGPFLGDADEARDRREARRDYDAPPRWAKTICPHCKREVADEADHTAEVCPYCGFDGEV